MSPTEILPGLLQVPVMIVVLMAVIIGIKLLWVKVIVPGLEEDARKIKGAIGEKRVAKALSVFTQANGYRRFGDLLLPNGRGGTTQIDFVMFSPYGIFVIEVKNYSGKVYVDPSDRMWTQQFGAHETPFQSPRKQNYGHIAALRELTGLPQEYFHSVVVMAGSAVIKTAVPPDVVYLHEMCDHIDSYKQEILSDGQIREAIGVVKENMKEKTPW